MHELLFGSDDGKNFVDFAFEIQIYFSMKIDLENHT